MRAFANRLSLFLSLCALLLVISSSCNRTTTPQANELNVAAAADLTDAFEQIGESFQTDQGTKVVFSFGSTGMLTRQIENGAPMDLFAAASLEYIDELEQKGLIVAGTKAVYARGRITLWTPKDSNLHISQISDLTRPEVKRIAIANPEHAPYGKAAQEALTRAGIWDVVKPKLVYGENIRQTLQYARTGNVEVAIVALSLSLQSDGQWTVVPEDLHKPIDQGLAVIKGTKNEKRAREFAEFIKGPRGREILAKYGFTFPN